MKTKVPATKRQTAAKKKPPIKKGAAKNKKSSVMAEVDNGFLANVMAMGNKGQDPRESQRLKNKPRKTATELLGDTPEEAQPIDSH